MSNGTEHCAPISGGVPVQSGQFVKEIWWRPGILTFLSIVLQVNMLVLQPNMSLNEHKQRIDERSYLFHFLPIAGISCDSSSLGVMAESCMGGTVAPLEVLELHGR